MSKREQQNFAVPFRYDDPIEDEPLDRKQALEIIEAIESWARSAVSDPPASPDAEDAGEDG